jgi:hypothetical protein
MWKSLHCIYFQLTKMNQKYIFLKAYNVSFSIICTQLTHMSRSVLIRSLCSFSKILHYASFINSLFSPWVLDALHSLISKLSSSHQDYCAFSGIPSTLYCLARKFIADIHLGNPGKACCSEKMLLKCTEQKPQCKLPDDGRTEGRKYNSMGFNIIFNKSVFSFQVSVNSTCTW